LITPCITAEADRNGPLRQRQIFIKWWPDIRPSCKIDKNCDRLQQ